MNREVTIEISHDIDAVLFRYWQLMQIISSEQVVACSFDIEKELNEVLEKLATYFAERAGNFI